MQRRKWDSRTKALVVIQGLKGKTVSEICIEHQISQGQYYLWRDQFLNNAAKAFEEKELTKREARLSRENSNLKRMVGELTMELKKSDEALL
jgi:transposase-like protein